MKAILFDVDDTLYDQVEPFRKAYEKLSGGRFDLDVGKLFLASRKHSDEVFEPSQRGEITMEEMYIYRIQKSFEDFGITITDREALEFQDYYSENQRHLTISPGMAELLEWCVKEGIPLGVITNGPSGHQRDKLRLLEITRWIPENHIIISGDCQWSKPEPGIFRLAEQVMGLQPENTYYVGDSYRNDVLGARNAGWKSVWLNKRKNRLAAGAVQPDVVVETEEELVMWVKSAFLPEGENGKV